MSVIIVYFVIYLTFILWAFRRELFDEAFSQAIAIFGGLGLFLLVLCKSVTYSEVTYDMSKDKIVIYENQKYLLRMSDDSPLEFIKIPENTTTAYRVVGRSLLGAENNQEIQFK